MLQVAFAILRAYIEMVVHESVIRSTLENLPAFDPLISMMHITILLKPFNNLRQYSITLHHQIQIDDRFG
ncbi:hypothetical protein D3C73_1268990 [compost metagenome]